jgi:hypothetical protein
MFVAQAYTFLAAGFETSGTALSYALYELALHPDIQHRLRAEILQVLNKHNGELTYDGMQEMPYLDMFVAGEGTEADSEGMRRKKNYDQLCATFFPQISQSLTQNSLIFIQEYAGLNLIIIWRLRMCHTQSVGS